MIKYLWNQLALSYNGSSNYYDGYHSIDVSMADGRQRVSRIKKDVHIRDHLGEYFKISAHTPKPGR